MIPAVAQTLAEILAGGTSLNSTEQIDFKHPGMQQDLKPALNLYCYDIRENNQVQHLGRHLESQYTQSKPPSTAVHRLALWFDVSFLISAWDGTALGEQRLLSEALTLLLRHRLLPEELLAPALRGYGSLSVTVSSVELMDAVSLWQALGTPLRPALYVTVTTPFQLVCTPPAPWVFGSLNQQSYPLNGNQAEKTTYPVAVVAGVVKSAATTQPLAATEVAIVGTKKATTSNQEGLFFFNDLPLGHYLLELRCPGYTSQQCQVLVDPQSYIFKEIQLIPNTFRQ